MLPAGEVNHSGCLKFGLTTSTHALKTCPDKTLMESGGLELPFLAALGIASGSKLHAQQLSRQTSSSGFCSMRYSSPCIRHSE